MLFVAEIGVNHDGNFDLAYELIRQAKLAGADIAKFQFGWRDGEGEINRIDGPRARQLREWCDYWSIEMMASVITPPALDLAHEAGLERYKIASRTVRDNPELCRRILAEGKETFVSLGMWGKPEFPFGAPDDRKLRYVFCRSSYPTYPSELSVLPDCFGPTGYYGYSDHLHGIEACLLAVARGAKYIEKHFTVNKTSKVTRDHVLSADPSEFSDLTRLGRPLGRLVEEISARRPALQKEIVA